MSLETENRIETQGEALVRLFEETSKAAAAAQMARQKFKEETLSPYKIIGEQTEGLDLRARAEQLGAMIVQKGLAEINAKEVRQKNLAELQSILMPSDEEPPVLLITSLSGNSIIRNFQSDRGTPNEVIPTVTGVVKSIGEYSVSILGYDQETYLVYPTEFSTGNTQIAISVLAPAEQQVA